MICIHRRAVEKLGVALVVVQDRVSVRQLLAARRAKKLVLAAAFAEITWAYICLGVRFTAKRVTPSSRIFILPRFARRILFCFFKFIVFYVVSYVLLKSIVRSTSPPFIGQAKLA